MVGLALLAVAAAATAALYLGQQDSAHASGARFEQFEALLETHRLSRLAVEQEIKDLQRELEKLTALLARNEVSTIKLEQLEEGIHRLEGKVESLSAIQMPSESSNGTGENLHEAKE
jgi:TolA-binding protein